MLPAHCAAFANTGVPLPLAMVGQEADEPSSSHALQEVFAGARTVDGPMQPGKLKEQGKGDIQRDGSTTISISEHAKNPRVATDQGPSGSAF